MFYGDYNFYLNKVKTIIKSANTHIDGHESKPAISILAIVANS